MENASKALLIAGAVLLVISIISVGMIIFSNSKAVVDGSVGQIDSMAFEMHNSQWNQYDNVTVKGSQVKEAISAALASNYKATDGRYGVAVYCNTTVGGALVAFVNPLIGSANNGGTTGNVTTMSTNIQNSFSYTGATTLNANGIVTRINFTRN